MLTASELLFFIHNSEGDDNMTWMLLGGGGGILLSGSRQIEHIMPSLWLTGKFLVGRTRESLPFFDKSSGSSN